MKAAVVWDPAYLEHEMGGHPEGADRLSHILGYLEAGDLWPRLAVVSPHAATIDDLLTVHTRAYVEIVRQAAEGGGRWLDPDTYVSPRSFDIALLAVGGALDALGGFELGEVRFALVRPPGHHALPDRAMGFCLFNNIAVAAHRLLAEGLERIAIVDWDVHHGNGTQAAFIDEPRVLFFSLHQWPLYPGSGWFNECGVSEGEGYTVNVPLPPGSHDGDYARAFDEIVGPIVDLYRPQAVLVSGRTGSACRRPPGQHVAHRGRVRLAGPSRAGAGAAPLRGPPGVDPRGRLRAHGDGALRGRHLARAPR